MYHVTAVIRAVPVRCARRAPDNITDRDPHGRAATVADPPRASQHGEQLAVGVRVPVRARTRREVDISHRHVFSRHDHVHQHIVSNKRVGDRSVAVDHWGAAVGRFGVLHRHGRIWSVCLYGSWAGVIYRRSDYQGSRATRREFGVMQRKG